MCSSSPHISRNITCHGPLFGRHKLLHPVACRLPVQTVRSDLKALGAGVRAYSIQQSAVQKIRQAHMASFGRKGGQGQIVGQFADAQQLESWLASHAIDTDVYGKDQAKTVAQLYQEVEDGETFFITSGASITRCVDVMVVYIRNNHNKVLQEEYQILPNGVKRARDVALAEKMKAGEAWQAAVVRAVKEELGSVLPAGYQVTIDESGHTTSIVTAISHSYPGLQSQYTIHKVSATVTGLPEDERFVTTEERPDGIMENHWLWTSETQDINSTGQ